MLANYIISFSLIFLAPFIPAHHHKHVPDNYDRLAYCESSHRPKLIDDPYYGAFQYNLSTWHAEKLKGKHLTGLPSNYTYKYQKRAARKLHSERGWEPWPACSVKLGL